MPLWPDDPGSENQLKILESGLAEFAREFSTVQSQNMAAKLGLAAISGPEDWALVEELFELMRSDEVDFPIFFDQLSRVSPGSSSWSDLGEIHAAFYNIEEMDAERRTYWSHWFAKYQSRTDRDPLSPGERQARMRTANPRFVLRNYLVQLAIDDLMAGSRKRFDRLLERLATPYEESHDDSDLCAKQPDWARTRPGCAMLSCSS